MPVRVGLKYIEEWKESMEAEIAEFEKTNPEKGQIVFYGPSYFTRWSKKWGAVPMEDVLLGKSGKKCVVNRGFGSSCSEHQLYFYPRAIRPIAPSSLVYAPYGNGIAFGYSEEEIWEIAQRVIIYAKTDFPDIKIYVCGAMARQGMTENQINGRLKFDKLVKESLQNIPGCYFIDMMGNASLRQEDIYIEDGVHLNEKGYRLYAELFREVLRDELDRY